MRYVKSINYILVFSVSVLFISQLVNTSSASASAGCVTKSEYKAIKLGMSRDKVHQILGTTGSLIGWTKMNGYKIEGRSYPTCHPYDVGVVMLNFEQKKLTIKTATFQ